MGDTGLHCPFLSFVFCPDKIKKGPRSLTPFPFKMKTRRPAKVLLWGQSPEHLCSHGYFFSPALTVILLAVPPKVHVYPGARDVAVVVTLRVWGGSGCLQRAPEAWATAFCPCPS